MPAEGVPQAFTDVQWSVDVMLSSSATRAPRLNATPLVTLALTLDDGSQRVYRLSSEELGQWRHALAKGLKDVEYLERKRRAAGNR